MARRPTGLRAWLRNRFARVREDPVIVFGNQKSGTSAIAALLAEFGGLSHTIDIPPLWGRSGMEVISGRVQLAQIVRRHPAYFASQVIKEPMTTFFIGKVLEVFPRSRCLFLVRDPRDNLRSQLNRRKLPGNLAQLEGEQGALLERFGALDTSVWGGAGQNYVGVLSQRWNVAVENYLAHRERLRLVRYEDFMADKLGCLRALAADLGIEERRDVTSRLEVDFQPRGQRGAKWAEFFGAQNLALIEVNCAVHMQRFGYQPSSAVERATRHDVR